MGLAQYTPFQPPGIWGLLMTKPHVFTNRSRKVACRAGQGREGRWEVRGAARPACGHPQLHNWNFQQSRAGLSPS